MHAIWPIKQRLAIFKFCPVSNFSKKTGRISIWAGLKPFLYTFYITLVMSKNWYRGFSRLVAQVSRLFTAKIVIFEILRGAFNKFVSFGVK